MQQTISLQIALVFMGLQNEWSLVKPSLRSPWDRMSTLRAPVFSAIWRGAVQTHFTAVSDGYVIHIHSIPVILTGSATTRHNMPTKRRCREYIGCMHRYSVICVKVRK